MGRSSHSRKEKETASSSSKRRRSKHEDSSDYESESDSSADDSSPRSGKERRSRRRRDDSSDSDRDSKRRKSSKKITEEELKEYMAKKAQKKALLARECALAEFQDWEKKEEEFHFDKSKVRSEIRLREGRTKPIDVLTKNLNPSDDMDIEINEPYMVFRGLTVKEMEELRDDIKMHLDLDRATETHTKYWEALLIVCDWELTEAQKKDALDRARVRGEQPPPELLAEERGLHSSIEEDVKKHLQGKSHRELEEYQAHIESEMRSGKAKVVEYWEAILKRLRIYKAKLISSTMAIVESPEPHRSDRTHLVLRYAVASRILLLTLIVLWRSIVDLYDTSALLNPNCISSSNGSDSDPLVNGAVLWPWIGSKIEGSIVWDGVYFSRIAQCGYEYEQTYAFLPLFPICMRVLSRTVFRPLVPLIGLRAVLGVSGYLLNIVAFSFAAMYMYRYSESLYSLLSVGGVYHLLSGEKSVAIILLALSGSVRSNGILNAGYVCFETLHRTYDTILHRKSAFAATKFLILGVLRSICIFVPFVAFQAYGYYNICLGRKPDEISPWCSARVPLLYNYIQSRYWGVGFLRYFQLKQLPNFLLASPILFLAICSVVHFVRLRPSFFISLGFKASHEEKNELISSAGQRLKVDSPSKSCTPTTQRDNQHFRKRIIVQGSGTKATPVDYEVSMSSRYYPVFLIPFVLHLAFMVATAFFVMHVQVSTRFLSACPPLYWYASHIMTSTDTGSKRRASLIWTYSAGYIFLGSLLFSNFYPFT
ncbi:unnamed protein product [Rhodiola kirilowii]